MTVKVVAQPDTLAVTTATYVVPQGEIWSLRSVVLNVTRGAGGIPGRGYKLEVSNGTNVVSAFAASDAGTDPGTCEITWADCPSGTGATAGAGIVSAPMRAQNMPPGYTVTASIVGSVAGDAIVSMVGWLDYVPDVGG